MIGTAQITTLVEQRLNTKEIKFWDSLQNLKIKSFTTNQEENSENG